MMNQAEFSRMNKSSLHPRYRIRLGRRYTVVASAIVVGLLGCPKFNSINSAVAQSVSLPQGVQQLPATAMAVPEVVDAKLVAANTKFGFKLFEEILKQDSSKNIFVSPSSVAIALAMTYNGASGQTQQAMAKTLELQGMSLQQINAANATLKATLENPDPKVQLSIANSLWARAGVSFKQDFLQRNQNFYQALVTNLDFSSPNAPIVINNWVKQSTGGKIEQIVETITSDQVLFLINAIYFKGKWTQEFNKKQTAEYPFYLAAGRQKQHLMMSQSSEYRYYENEKFQAVSLPYGENERLSLYIFLPVKNSSLSTLYKTLNAQNWEKWMTRFRSRKGFIRLPRFKMQYDIELKDALAALGMGVAFSDNNANFSGMSDSKLSIDEVKHETFVEVNEEGTEAAAVTSVVMVGVSAVSLLEEPFQMIVDRPFFCAIRDNQTGTVLFMGSIVNP
jgi:serpin B